MRFFNYFCGKDLKVGYEDGGRRYSVPFECDMNGLIQNYTENRDIIKPCDGDEMKTEVRYAPAVTAPQKILCVGLNYENHIGEMKDKKLSVPTVFGKYNNALSAHMEEIPLPYEGGKFDYEAELVIVMGRECRNISPENAGEYIFGYTAGNDLSVREVQAQTSQWLLAKSPDKFAPIGPCIVTADSIDISDLKIQSRVNGEVRQSSTTRNMIFSCADIVAHISRYMTLMPGDVIFTGTPGGVMLGYPEDKQVWLKAGDRVEIEIEKIGTLTTFLK